MSGALTLPVPQQKRRPSPSELAALIDEMGLRKESDLKGGRLTSRRVLKHDPKKMAPEKVARIVNVRVTPAKGRQQTKNAGRQWKRKRNRVPRVVNGRDPMRPDTYRNPSAVVLVRGNRGAVAYPVD